MMRWLNRLNNACLYRAMLCICGTSHGPVRHKSEFYENGWTNRAGFWHVSFLPPVLHCVKRKFGYLQNKGTSLWNFELRKFHHGILICTLSILCWISLCCVLWRCWLGDRKGIRPVKNWVVGCWRGYLPGARCRLAYGPTDATATHCLLLQLSLSPSLSGNYCYYTCLTAAFPGQPG